MSSHSEHNGIYCELNQDWLAAYLQPNEQLLFALPCSLSKAGHFTTEPGSVLFTSTRIVQITSDAHGSITTTAEIPLHEVQSIEAESLVGNGRLTLWQNDGQAWHFCRFTVDEKPLYRAAAQYVQRYLKDGILRPIDPVEQLRCRECGRYLGDTRVCPACLNTAKVLRRLFRILQPHLRLAAAAAVVFWVLTGVNLLVPQVQRLLIDRVIEPQVQDIRLLVLLVLGLASARLAATGLSILRGQLMVGLSACLGRDLRQLVYSKIQALSLRSIDQRRTGDLMNRVSRDTQHIQSFLERDAPEVINQGLLLVGISAILLVSSWRMFLLIMIPAPLIVLFSLHIRLLLRRMYRQEFQLSDKTNSLLQDVLSGIRVVKAFGAEKREADRFQHQAWRLAEVSIRNEQVFQTVFPAMGFLMGCGSFLILLYGGQLVFQRQMLPGELIQFSTYASMLYGPLQYMAFIPRWFHQAMTSCERIFEVIDEEPEVRDRPDPIRIQNIVGDIELRGVTFGYTRHEPVLHAVSVHIKPGEMLGLVGHSGAGKSTLINLINRFYDVDEGSIHIDGIDIRNLSQQDLRQQIGVVLQQTFLFTGTLWENIAYARPDASPSEVIAAAKIANAHDFIVTFPDGYDTRVGERGQRLSGGERQRIAIARAVLHNPSMLILDEATASVDTQTEQLIQEALQRLVQGRTTIAIAHRLSTLRWADRLLVLDHGRQVELGTHEELMRAKGTYYRLVMAQREMSRMQAI